MTVNPPTGLTGGRYTLPAELGGGEVEITWPDSTAARPGGRVDCELDVVSLGVKVTLNLPYRLLTPVKPPLPEEPGLEAIRVDRFNVVWQRNGKKGRHCWYAAKDVPDLDWETLNRDRGPLVNVVTDPFAEPVQLPYYTSEFTLKVDGPKVEFGYRDVFRQWVTPERTRELARAAWAAANQADNAGGNPT